jgi:hypothetical protein
VALALGMKNPRERLGSVVRLSTLAGRGGKIIQIFHCVSLWLSFIIWRLSSSFAEVDLA